MVQNTRIFDNSFTIQGNLPIRAVPDYRQDLFYKSECNKDAWHLINGTDPMLWPQNRLLILAPKGSGKTHLAHIWQSITNAVIINFQEIQKNNRDIEYILSSNRSIVCENIDSCVDEILLLYILNNSYDKKSKVLLTGSESLNFILPQLKSIINAIYTVKITDPDINTIKAIIEKISSDLCIDLEDAAIEYIVNKAIGTGFTVLSTLHRSLELIKQKINKEKVSVSQLTKVMAHFSKVN